MERVTISLDEDLLGHFDNYLEKKAIPAARKRSGISFATGWSRKS